MRYLEKQTWILYLEFRIGKKLLLLHLQRVHDCNLTRDLRRIRPTEMRVSVQRDVPCSWIFIRLHRDRSSLVLLLGHCNGRDE